MAPRARLVASKAPRSPYPPDADEEQELDSKPGDLVDAVMKDRDWANERVRRWSALRAELRRCRFTGAELAEATIRDVAFDECRLDLVGFRHARFERVAFRDCRLGECDFYGASLQDVLFERCELGEANFSACKLQRVELRGCDLRGLRGAEALRGARMPWNDVIENAPLFAAVVGIEVVE
jgi:uncharacterized protein YjbI with pentapeptide repeats